MTELTNFIRFNVDGTLIGNIASLDLDLTVTGEKLSKNNDDAPVWRVRNRDDGTNYQVRIIDGEQVVATRPPRRAEPRFLEYAVKGDTRRIWW